LVTRGGVKYVVDTHILANGDQALRYENVPKRPRMHAGFRSKRFNGMKTTMWQRFA
jgi:hypothetical protein